MSPWKHRAAFRFHLMTRELQARLPHREKVFFVEREAGSAAAVGMAIIGVGSHSALYLKLAYDEYFFARHHQAVD